SRLPATDLGAGRAHRPAPLAGRGFDGGIRHSVLLSAARLSGRPYLDGADRRVRYGAGFWPPDRGLHVAVHRLPVFCMAGEPGERPAASVRLDSSRDRGLDVALGGRERAGPESPCFRTGEQATGYRGTAIPAR